MKYKIFIAIHYMEVGGAERALLGLLNALDTDKIDVDLFIYWHTGEFMSLIPKKINVLPEIPTYSMIEKPIKEVIKFCYIKIAIARLWAKILTNIYKKLHPFKNRSSTDAFIGRIISKVLPDINGKYDLAISFLTPHNYVLDHVNAKRKIAWIHTDYTNIQVFKKWEKQIWNKYDYIASISDDVTKSFLDVFPELKAKIIVIKNILSTSFVRSQSLINDVHQEMPTENNTLRLLSIGRISPQKNFDNIPDICQRVNNMLTNNNSEYVLKIKWYIIGYGPDEMLLKERIKESEVEDSVILLGKKTNPYPYIRECDIYVQPSRYEGNCVAVREAQILEKPVIITNYPTATSQVENDKDGIIIPLDNKQCAEGIANFIMDSKKQKDIRNYLKNHDYGNEKEVDIIYRLLGI